MKIIEASETRLLAVEKNTGNLFIGALAIAIGIGTAVFSSESKSSLLMYSLIPIIIGVTFIVLRRVVTMDLDKTSGQAHISMKTLVKKVQSDCAIGEVQDIQLQTIQRMTQNQQGNTGTQLETKLLMYLHSGVVIDLSDKSQNFSIMGIGKVPNQDIGQQIAAFLSVPFTVTGPPTINQAVSAVEQMVTGQQSVTAVSSVLPVVPIDDIRQVEQPMTEVQVNDTQPQ